MHSLETTLYESKYCCLSSANVVWAKKNYLWTDAVCFIWNSYQFHISAWFHAAVIHSGCNSLTIRKFCTFLIKDTSFFVLEKCHIISFSLQQELGDKSRTLLGLAENFSTPLYIKYKTELEQTTRELLFVLNICHYSIYSLLVST